MRGYAAIMHFMRPIIDSILGYSTSELLKDKWESERVVNAYIKPVYLDKAEETILNGLRNRLANMKMLDIGIGAGRTTHYFAPIAKDYVGVDISRRMIEICQKRTQEHSKKISLGITDVRALNFKDGCFDFVLFSFNGLDHLTHEDRLTGLHEIRRVIKSGGSFCFSTLNLSSSHTFFAFQPTRNPILLAYRVRDALLLRLNNKKFGPQDMRKRQFVIYNIIDRNVWQPVHFVRTQEQIRQLNSLGFKNVRVFGLSDGREIEEPFKTENEKDSWLYYLCDV